MQQLSVRLRWFIWEETNGPFKVFLHRCAAAVPCAWDGRRVHRVGNEVRLYGRPHCCGVLAGAPWPEVMVKTCVCLLTQQMVSSCRKWWFLSSWNILQFVRKIWLKGFIEFGICNKNGINTCNKKQAVVYYIWTDEKAAAPGFQR